MGISIWQLLIVLLIVVLLFGTKKLRSIGTDLGGAMRGFRNAVRDPNEEESESGKDQVQHRDSERVIEGKVENNENKRV